MKFISFFHLSCGSRKLAALGLALVLSSSALNAATYCITPAGAGSKTGVDWNNAYASLPASLVRGSTYYMAGGTYPSCTVAVVSGTNCITIKHATGFDHGTDTGWSSAFTNQTIFAGLVLRASYVVIDGATGAGMNGYGILSYTTATDDTAMGIDGGAWGEANHLIVQNMEVSAPEPQTGLTTMAIWCNQPCGGHTFSNLYVHGGCGWVQYSYGGACSNITIANCTFSHCGSSGGPHSAGLIFSGAKNVTIKNSLLRDPLLNATATFIEPQGTSGTDGLYVYGNVFLTTSSGSMIPEGCLWFTSSDSGQNVYFYNNTIYGLGSGGGCGVGANQAGSTIYVSNNLWQACSGVPNLNSPGVSAGNNILNTGVASFVNAAGEDFHLATGTAAGILLGSPYDIDPDGKTRGADGVWDIGAYEYSLVIPIINGILPSGTNLIISGTNGSPNGSYLVLASTNLLLPLTNWMRLSTNSFDGSGNFIFINPINPNIPRLFYILQSQ